MRKGSGPAVYSSTASEETMSRAFMLCLIVLGTALCRGQDSKPASWQSLLESGKCEEARRLCAPWISKDTAQQVEAHKCLANVALCGTDRVVTLEGNDQGGGTLGSTFKPEAVDEALQHLNQALKLAPQDLTVHQGRLHLLEVSSRYSEMANALDESCNIYKGVEGVDPWLPYTSELYDEKQFRASLALLEVLNKHYPDSHDVLGNMGAMHIMLNEDDQGIPFLRRAVDLAPKDPIDAWNLGRAYDYAEKIEHADQWYQKALALEPASPAHDHRACVYADFVEKKLHDSKRACDLQRANCAASEQSACSALKYKRPRAQKNPLWSTVYSSWRTLSPIISVTVTNLKPSSFRLRIKWSVAITV